MNLAAVDALEVHARDAEVRVLALDHDERDSLVRHLDRVRMSQLMVVPTSAQAPICRPLGYADASGEPPRVGGMSQ